MFGNEEGSEIGQEMLECGDLISTCYVVTHVNGTVESTIYLDFPPRTEATATIYRCDHVFQAATYLRQHGVKRPLIKWLAK